MKSEPTFDELWKEAVCDTVKSMTAADFDELVRQRDAASRPAPKAEELPTAPPPPMSPVDSIAQKRNRARREGRTAL